MGVILPPAIFGYPSHSSSKFANFVDLLDLHCKKCKVKRGVYARMHAPPNIWG